MVVAGEWEALETGRRWRLGGAGDWEALETGRRWRMGGAGEFRAPAPFSRPLLCHGLPSGRLRRLIWRPYPIAAHFGYGVFRAHL